MIGLVMAGLIWVSPAQAKQGVAADVGDFTFFALADPQINIPKWGTAGTRKTIRMMNDLPGSETPFGTVVEEPRGVLIAGDLVDDMGNRENWRGYKDLFDPQGEGRLRYPVYAGAGNHDLTSDTGFGEFNWLQKELIARNRRRPAELNLGPNGYHYSWNWEGMHFVNLNVFPGNDHRPVYDNHAPWNDPKESLGFLKKDLAEHVGESGRPVILMWHYGLRGWGNSLVREPMPVVYNQSAPIEWFDFIVVNECHRSIYNLWRQVLDYFDAFLIGLTAPPTKQTIGFFNGNLVYDYSHEKAVADRNCVCSD